MVDVLRVPLAVSPSGRFAVLPQGSVGEVGQACRMLLWNRAAAPDLDGFDPTFTVDGDAAAAAAAAVLVRYEDRVDPAAAAEIAADYTAAVDVAAEVR